MPLFTFVVPTYNRAQLLQRCIASVQRQAGNWELVVADDGSTDETESLVAKLADSDPRIVYRRQENLGAGDARNLGASVACGTYLVFLDSDDELLPQWSEVFERAVAGNEVAIACCGIRWISEDGEVRETTMPTAVDQTSTAQAGLFRSGTFAIRADVFHTVGGYAAGLQANQHSEFSFRLLPACAQHAWELKNIDQPLVLAHDHSGEKVRKNTEAIFESGRYVLTRHRELLRCQPVTCSHWAAAVGGCAAKLGRYSDARHWFSEAIRVRPLGIKNYSRLLIACTPGLRNRVWQRAETPDSA